MLFRVAAAAGRRAAGCARLQRPVNQAGRPPSYSLRRAERLLGKPAGEGWLAHRLTGGPGMWLTWEGSSGCFGGADRLNRRHDGAASSACAVSGASTTNHHHNRLQLVAKISCRCMAKISIWSSTGSDWWKDDGQRAKTH